MPGEQTRRPPRLQVLEGGLDFEIRERDGTVRVALSGALDRAMLGRIAAAVAPRLVRRGRAVVLDGRRLNHVDYRCAADLAAWQRVLRPYGHRLLLSGWSVFHRTLLILGGMPGEPPRDAAGRLSGGGAAGSS